MIEGLKPYPEYKDSGISWIDSIPQRWVVRRMKSAAMVNPSKSESAALYRTDAPATFLPMQCVGVDGRYDASVRRPVSELWNGFTYFRRNDVLVAKITPCFENGKGACLDALPTEIGFGSTEFHVLRAGLNLTPRFLFYVTKLQVFRDLGANSMTGSAGQQRVTTDFVGDYPVLIPPLIEQAAIVRFLGHVNRRIERFIRAKKKLIALLNEQKQAIIQRAVTRGLDPDVRLKSSGIKWIGNIPEHWEVVPLKSVCTIQSGITLGKSYLGEVVAEFPYLRVANVQAGRLNLQVLKTLKLPQREASRSMLKEGDVLMTEGGDPDKLGRACLWANQVEDCLHQNHVFAVRPNPRKLTSAFLVTLLGTQYSRSYFLRTAKQTTNLASTNKTTIGNFRVLLPSVDEQSRILFNLSSELGPVNGAIDRAERAIGLFVECRKRLLSDVVTGQLDVCEVARHLPDEIDGPNYEFYEDGGEDLELESELTEAEDDV